jgi:hypothetical protein
MVYIYIYVCVLCVSYVYSGSYLHTTYTNMGRYDPGNFGTYRTARFGVKQYYFNRWDWNFRSKHPTTQ